jgi:uncharacterized protein YycO
MEILEFITKPITKAISLVARPEFIIDDVDVAKIKANLKNGDALVSRVNYELSNGVEKLLMGSFWGHSAIYLNGYIYEAVTGSVRKTSLEKFCFTKDGVGVCRLPGSDWTDIQIRDMVSFCEEQLGEPYDFSFNWGRVDRWYCSKLVYFAWDIGKAIETEAIESINSLGTKKIAPHNIWNGAIKVLQVGYKG